MSRLTTAAGIGYNDPAETSCTAGVFVRQERNAQLNTWRQSASVMVDGNARATRLSNDRKLSRRRFAMSTQRKSIGKGKRFNIFRRDSFTCRYCGAQPPEAVLEIDHVIPVAAGGDNDDDNLVTACWTCNRGKSAKSLDAAPPIDADIKWLEMQQEIAELRRYQEAKIERDAEIEDVICALNETWVRWSRRSWYIKDYTLRELLELYGPEDVERAIIITGTKVAQKYVSGSDLSWLKYMHGVLRNMGQERDQ